MPALAHARSQWRVHFPKFPEQIPEKKSPNFGKKRTGNNARVLTVSGGAGGSTSARTGARTTSTANLSPTPESRVTSSPGLTTKNHGRTVPLPLPQHTQQAQRARLAQQAQQAQYAQHPAPRHPAITLLTPCSTPLAITPRSAVAVQCMAQRSDRIPMAAT